MFVRGMSRSFEHALQELRPSFARDGIYAGFAGAKTDHGLVALFRGFVILQLNWVALSMPGGFHFGTVFAVGCEHAMKPKTLGSPISTLVYDCK